jgi:hypothetical protein
MSYWESFNELTLPISKEEVDILNQALRILVDKNQLLDKDLESLCNNDNSISKRIKYCLLETNAAKKDKHFDTRIFSNGEYPKRFLDIDYYNIAYTHKKEKEERLFFELKKLKEDLVLAKKQSKYAFYALIISIIAILAQVLSPIIAILK